MTTWPLAFFKGSTALDFENRAQEGLKKKLNSANEEYTQTEKRRLMILSLLVSQIYGAF